MKKIETNLAPKAIGSYSQAVIVENLVYTSGQIPINPNSGKIEAIDIVSQTEQVAKNLAAILQAAGSSLENIIKTTCFIKSIEQFPNFNEAYSKYFTEKPARSCVEVSALPKGALVEIEAIALINK